MTSYGLALPDVLAPGDYRLAAILYDATRPMRASPRLPAPIRVTAQFGAPGRYAGGGPKRASCGGEGRGGRRMRRGWHWFTVMVVVGLVVGVAGCAPQAACIRAPVRTPVDAATVRRWSGSGSMCRPIRDLLRRRSARGTSANRWRSCFGLGAHPLAVQAIRYYNGDGTLVLTCGRAVSVAAMAYAMTVAPQRQRRRRGRKHFIVRWAAGTPVVAPNVWAVMISAADQQVSRSSPTPSSSKRQSR
ncbi:MAG: DUF3124 domain-containing protein [Caldilineaceae bacterium]